ncbi:NAD-dependent epimerase/dehydratase family protein [Aliagarivorans marinus]|uniref:NAD-dependent epimerase/dehydratase family protein n=1 Tax=Aliagarivorans marinus TaxID=561965 RepID=UPI00041D9DEF|nr:NAD-dependent epimerase/dehydratase family protein [Aliagarivorans marinus]
MKILLFGASGMVGSLLLSLCLNSPQVSQVTIVVRKATGRSHSKLQEVIDTQWMNPQQPKDYLQGVDICFYCVGVYLGQVGRAQYKEIAGNYALRVASPLAEVSPHAQFHFLSSRGADRSQSSGFLPGKVLGHAEAQLEEVLDTRLCCYRPGYIYPVVRRQEPHIGYRLMRQLYPPLSTLFPDMGIASDYLALAMLSNALSDAPQFIMENADLHRLAELQALAD